MGLAADLSEGALTGADPVAARLAAAEGRVAALERQLADLHAASVDSNADDEHDPEGATIAFERQLLVTLLDQARASVAALQAAASRGSSGVSCEVCGRPIPAERLAVRPQATRCVPCASGQPAGG